MSSKLQYRFSQYEVQPPAEVWAGIASRLDVEYNRKDSALAEKTGNSETPVPAGLWSRITDELDQLDIADAGSRVIPINTPVAAERTETPRTPVVPFTLRRVAAAGVLLLGISALWYFFNQQTQVPPRLVTVTPQDQQPARATVVPDAVLNAPVIAENRPRNNSNRNIVRFTSATPDIRNQDAADDNSTEEKEPENDNITYSNVSHAEKTEEQPISVTTQPIRDKDGNIIMNEKLVSSPDLNYITVTAPNGEQTKMSKKFLDALGYMNSTMVKDDYPGLMLQEGSSWKWLFQEWRNKLLRQPSFIPSATNFLDIMELKEMLHENF